MPAGAVQVQLLSWLREHSNDEEFQGKLRGDTGHAVTEWVEREKVARRAGVLDVMAVQHTKSLRMSA